MTGSDEYADGDTQTLGGRISDGVHLEMALGFVTAVALLFSLNGSGPDWIWTGCMDPGPNVTGCASVFPIGILGPLFAGAVVALAAIKIRGQKDE